jgi:uncharacterized protein YndB with AHSA1/START domain
MTKLKLTAEPGKHDILMSREFDARRELVFRAYTDPALVARWWGTNDATTTVDVMEVKKGGIWRYIQRDADGNEYAFNGVYHDIAAPERLVYTFEFEGMPGHVLLETITFEAHGDKTTMTDQAIYQSVADRDGMIQSGMESGAQQSWDRFEEVLRTL